MPRSDGTFEDVALLAGVAVSGDGLEQAGMGTDFGDYDNDGWLDLTKSNFAFEPTNLYHSAPAARRGCWCRGHRLRHRRWLREPRPEVVGVARAAGGGVS